MRKKTKKKKFDPQITKVVLDIEQAVLSCCKHCGSSWTHYTPGHESAPCAKRACGVGCYHNSGAHSAGAS